MNCHVDVVLVADRHDGVQEINKVLKELVLIHILIKLEQLLDMCHTLRFPAGHH